jgi:hypothetical protein
VGADGVLCDVCAAERVPATAAAAAAANTTMCSEVSGTVV